MTATAPPGAFRDVPFMGVIWVVHEATKLGFVNGHPDWCNLGQGQPEVGEMAGAPPRHTTIELEPGDHAYGPLGGTPELREAIAAHYNRLYRKGKRSQYTAANVCVAQGGRLALTRIFAALGEGQDGFQLPVERIESEIDEKGLSAFLVSNPCNPTGNVIQGRDLAALVELARTHGTTMLLDEFYSHFIYTPEGQPGAGPVSGAAYVQGVEKEPVLLVDGLTKSFRYPGWRVGWTLGPAPLMETLARAASSIDGGPSRIAQRAALAVL